MRLLVVAALIGAPIAAGSYLFLAAASQLEHWVYIKLPDQLGFSGVPGWWPILPLLLGGVLVAATIKYLPGIGGHKPADGFKAGGLFPAAELPGVAIAALVTLGCGAVLGPEAPLIALGGGVAAWAVSHAVKGDKSRVTVVVAAAGSFAAISTLLDNPLVGAFLLMEASGLAGATLELVLLPGLLAAGIGALIFTGMGHWTGLGTFSLSIPHLPAVVRPSASEFGWALLIGLAAAVVGSGIRRLALRALPAAERWIFIGTPLAGLLVAGLAITFQQVTGHTTADVLFSGQSQLTPFVEQRASYGLAALFLLLACKSLAYSLCLATFRGGPTFPAIFIGAAGGLALAHLPGLPVVPALGIAMGAMLTAMLRLPMTSALLAVILLFSDGAAIIPLVIVAVAVSYVGSVHLDKLGKYGEPESSRQGASAPSAQSDGGTGQPRPA